MWDIRQDKRYARYMNSIEWDVDLIGSVYLYTKKLPLLPLSLTKVQRPQSKISADDIWNVARKHRSFYILLECINKSQFDHYRGNSFKQTTNISLPSKTIHIDLSQSKNLLLNQMHSKTRYNIKKYKRNESLLSISRDIDKFVHYWQKAARDRGMFISQMREIRSLYTAFSSTSVIYLFEYNSNVVAGLLCIGSAKTMTYMHAFSNTKANVLYAPTLMAWKSIRDAKEKGYELYDFEGIYDERTSLTSWKGFTRFKQGFGGNVITYPLPLHRYWLPFSLI